MDARPPDTPHRARTELEKSARRSLIKKEAASQLADLGVDVMTMSGLARQCGLAKGTLYLYFRSKE